MKDNNESFRLKSHINLNKTQFKALTYAINQIGRNGQSQVTIAEVARELDVTSQALYRYFQNKEDLMNRALSYDLESLHVKALARTSTSNWPLMSGAYWAGLSGLRTQHPYIGKMAALRDPHTLRMIEKSSAVKWRNRQLELEIIRGQSMGLIRTDVAGKVLTESIKSLSSTVAFPLIFESGFNSKKWIQFTTAITAALFYPFPDLSTPERIEEFAGRFV